MRTDNDSEIFACAERLLRQLWDSDTPVRLIGVGLSGFAEPSRQLGMFGEEESLANRNEFQSALDRLRDKYGEKSIRRASDLHYRPVEDNRR